MSKKLQDLTRIDGIRVTTVVKEYQSTIREWPPCPGDSFLLDKIVKHYRIFRETWGKQFAKSGNMSLKAGMKEHDDIIARSAKRFKGDWPEPDQFGCPFNKYVVSVLLNQVKSYHCQARSRNMFPRVIKES